jgi:spore coat polysaccharide biosynthesis protein SpsF
LMVPELIDHAIGLYRTAEHDLATNVMTRSFPKGMSVEVIRVVALQRAQAMMIDGEAEHVTPPFYRRPGDFRIADFTSGQDWGAVQLSVDTQDDFTAIERVIAAVGDRLNDCSVADLVKLRQSL